MCGADHGPEHDDPTASRICDLYHEFAPADLPRLGVQLDEREKELLWHLALGIGPEGLARRGGAEVTHVRGELEALEGRLAGLLGTPT